MGEEATELEAAAKATELEAAAKATELEAAAAKAKAVEADNIEANKKAANEVDINTFNIKKTNADKKDIDIYLVESDEYFVTVTHDIPNKGYITRVKKYTNDKGSVKQLISNEQKYTNNKRPVNQVLNEQNTQQSLFDIQIPPNIPSGTELQVRVPDGSLVNVTVPPGLPTGGKIRISMKGQQAFIEKVFGPQQNQQPNQPPNQQPNQQQSLLPSPPLTQQQLKRGRKISNEVSKFQLKLLPMVTELTKMYWDAHDNIMYMNKTNSDAHNNKKSNKLLKNIL